MADPHWWSGWRHDAMHRLIAKNEALAAEYETGRWPRYDYDLDARRLVFSDDDGPKVVAEVQVVGTTGFKDFLWGWANDHWGPSLVEDVLRVRAFGVEHGIEELTTDRLEDDDDLNALGWECAAVAARVVDALGAYRPQTEDGRGLFLIYRTINRVT